MYLTGLEKRLDALWESQLPFIVFRLPESQKITLFTQENDILHALASGKSIDFKVFFKK